MTGRSTPGTFSNSRGVTMARLLAVVGSLRGAAGWLFCSASFCLAAARRFRIAARSARAICSARTAGSTASGSVAAMCSILATWFLACSARSSRAASACSTVMPSGVAPPGPAPSAAGALGAAGAWRRPRAAFGGGVLRQAASFGAGETTGVARVRGDTGTMVLAWVAGAVSVASSNSLNWRRVGGPPPASWPSFSASSLMVRSAARSRARTWEDRSVRGITGTESARTEFHRGVGNATAPAGDFGLRRARPGPECPDVHLWPAAIRGGCGWEAVPDSWQTHSVLAGWVISKAGSCCAVAVPAAPFPALAVAACPASGDRRRG